MTDGRKPTTVRRWLDELASRGSAQTGSLSNVVVGTIHAEWRHDGVCQWPSDRLGAGIDERLYPDTWRRAVGAELGRAFVDGRSKIAVALRIVEPPARCESRKVEETGRRRSWRCDRPAGRHDDGFHRSRAGHRRWPVADESAAPR